LTATYPEYWLTVQPCSAVVILKILVKNGRRVNRETHFEILLQQSWPASECPLNRDFRDQ
jgi:hypothetical protein